MEYIERLIWHAERVPRTRTKSMKVLAFGLSRSGTESMRNALSILGYNYVYHGFDVAPDAEAWVRLARHKYGSAHQSDATGDCTISASEFDTIPGHCEAVTDCPPACFAAELYKAYPEATVIMNYRDVDEWYRSIVATFGRDSPLRRGKASFFGGWLCAQDYWLRLGFWWFYEKFYYGSLEAHCKWVHQGRMNMVRGMVPCEKLLEYEIGVDGWQPLCKFLEKDVPDEPFPHGNMPEQLHRRAAEIFARYDRVRKRNIAIFWAVMTVGVGVLSYGVSQIVVRGWPGI